MISLEGGCHCGSIRFTVTFAARECLDCDCSVCTKKGFLHLIVPARDFRLLSGEEALVTYTFNTGVARHRFCRICGIKSFYIPRSNPDGVDVNLRCLETPPAAVNIVPFDGRHWEQHAARLAHKSR